MLRFGAIFDRFVPFSIENRADTIENGAKTIENGGAVFDRFGGTSEDTT